MVLQSIHGRNSHCRIKSKFIIILYRILQNLAQTTFPVLPVTPLQTAYIPASGNLPSFLMMPSHGTSTTQKALFFPNFSLFHTVSKYSFPLSFQRLRFIRQNSAQVSSPYQSLLWSPRPLPLCFPGILGSSFVNQNCIVSVYMSLSY